MTGRPISRWRAHVGGAIFGLLAILNVDALILSRLPLEELGLRFHLGIPKVVMLLAVMAPLALVAPAVQMYFSCFARPFEEAQSYIVVLVAFVTVPGIVSMFYPLNNRAWTTAIAVLAQYSMGADILAGKVPSSMGFIGAGIEGVVLTGVFLWLAGRPFSAERVIFGR